MSSAMYEIHKWALTLYNYMSESIDLLQGQMEWSKWRVIAPGFDVNYETGHKTGGGE